MGYTDKGSQHVISVRLHIHASPLHCHTASVGSVQSRAKSRQAGPHYRAQQLFVIRTLIRRRDYLPPDSSRLGRSLSIQSRCCHVKGTAPTSMSIDWRPANEASDGRKRTHFSAAKDASDVKSFHRASICGTNTCGSSPLRWSWADTRLALEPTSRRNYILKGVSLVLSDGGRAQCLGRRNGP